MLPAPFSPDTAACVPALRSPGGLCGSVGAPPVPAHGGEPTQCQAEVLYEARAETFGRAATEAQGKATGCRCCVGGSRGYMV